MNPFCINFSKTKSSHWHVSSCRAGCLDALRLWFKPGTPGCLAPKSSASPEPQTLAAGAPEPLPRAPACISVDVHQNPVLSENVVIFRDWQSSQMPVTSLPTCTFKCRYTGVKWLCAIPFLAAEPFPVRVIHVPLQYLVCALGTLARKQVREIEAQALFT